MFANRFTALVDACSLANALKRNLLLSLAEAGFFRVRWSKEILDETERAIAKILTAKYPEEAEQRAQEARLAMESAFEEAMVDDFNHLMTACTGLPDPNDRHVMAAALKTHASMIVTENIRHFPADVLAPNALEAKTADMFIADTLSLDIGRGVAAIRIMRERFQRPAITATELLLKLEAAGFPETVDVLRDHASSL